MTTNKIVLLMFFSERCGFCKTQNSILEELKKDMGNKIDIIRIDIDKDRDIANKWNIDATPTLFILKNDSISQKYVGLTNKNELESTINKYI